MAGDFIMLDAELPLKLEVVQLQGRSGEELGTIIGRLFLLWAWADRVTTDGFLPGITVNELTAKCGGTPAFWNLVQAVGWLILDDSGARIPKFEERFGASARKRILHSKRVAGNRAGQKAAAGSGASGASAAGNGAREAHTRRTRGAQPAHRCAPAGAPNTSTKDHNNPPLPPQGGEGSEPDEPAPEPTDGGGSDPDPVVLEYPTVGAGLGRDPWALRKSKVAEFQASFPGVDVLAECRKALQWCRDNPSKRKTHRGMAAFLCRWLADEQDRGRRPMPVAKGSDGFDQFLKGT